MVRTRLMISALAIAPFLAGVSAHAADYNYPPPPVYQPPPQPIISRPRWRVSRFIACLIPNPSSRKAAIIVMASVADAIFPKTDPFTAF